MKLTVRETAVFAMLGALMYASKMVMEVIPKVHLLGMFIVAFTVVYRKKALYPIYVFVFIIGLMNGFATRWLPYLYIWTVLWGVTMLLPKRMPQWLCCVVYPLVCGLHGLAFGILYAPTQALFYGMSWDMTIAWVVAGLPFDAIHAAGNVLAGLLVVPLTLLLNRLMRIPYRSI